MTLRGSCQCGAVSFELEPPFARFIHCYCSRCRKATGTGRASNLVLSPSQLRWLSGEEQIARFDLPQARSFATCFCRRCGSPLPHPTRSGRELIVPAGTLDDPLPHGPTRRAHWSSRAGWIAERDCDLPDLE
ncbi:MAG: GFA family protein [Myxococcota bacterium]